MRITFAFIGRRLAATLAAVAAATAAGGAAVPAAAAAAGTPRVTLTALPTTLVVGRSYPVTVTVTGLPAAARTVSLGLRGTGHTGCAPARVAAARLRATLSCRLRVTPGATLFAQAAATVGDRRYAGSAVRRTVRTPVTTTIAVPATLRWRTGATLRLTVDAPLLRAGTRLTVGVGGSGVHRCPTRTLALPGTHRLTVACAVLPMQVAVARLRVAVTAPAATLLATGNTERRPVHDAVAVSAEAARAEWEERTDSQLARDLAAAGAPVLTGIGQVAMWLELHTGGAGWRNARARDLRDRLLALRTPDGGYGIGRAWDAFGDGSTNPADTTYSYTIANVAGPLLLRAWLAGELPDRYLREPVDALLRAPAAPTRTPGGACIGYSALPEDARVCVPNVSFGSARFLADVARETGWEVPGLADRVAAVTRTIPELYLPASGAWPYLAGRTRPQDHSHNAYTIRSVLALDPAFGRRALAAFTAHPLWWLPATATQGSSTPYHRHIGLVQVAWTDCRYARHAQVRDAFAQISAQYSGANVALWGYRVLETCGYPPLTAVRGTIWERAGPAAAATARPRAPARPG
ncbi:hypothetical protein [Pilimelia terevasa]|nr:hypothetical protein [Pilimelia terevasa]